ncbi:hypothetical protein ACXX9E_29785 [Pseudomonas sp. GNP014]
MQGADQAAVADAATLAVAERLARRSAAKLALAEQNLEARDESGALRDVAAVTRAVRRASAVSKGDRIRVRRRQCADQSRAQLLMAKSAGLPLKRGSRVRRHNLMAAGAAPVVAAAFCTCWC